MASEGWQRILRAEASAERELAAVPDWLWDGKTLPVPVEHIADTHYGLLVSEHDDLAEMAGLEPGSAVSGLLLPDRREVWVNAEEAARAPARRRFSVGHELGHWVLHCRFGAHPSAHVVHCRRSEVREEAAAEADQFIDDYAPDELDANQFAAALLMPRSLVLREHERSGGDERVLCETFGVSGIALQRRLWFLTATPSTPR